MAETLDDRAMADADAEEKSLGYASQRVFCAAAIVIAPRAQTLAMPVAITIVFEPASNSPA